MYKITKNVYIFYNIFENVCIIQKKAVTLHRDFFIVLDLRLINIRGCRETAPFAIY